MKIHRAAILAFLLSMGWIFPLSAGAAEGGVQERSFRWSADVLDSNFRSDTLELLGNVRVVQGPMSIEAQQATASAFRSEDSRWQFDKSVRMRTEDADLQSNTASAAFANGELKDARIEGSPATFEQRGGAVDRLVRGRASVIEYDVAGGIVKLTGDVWFSYGKDEFRGDTVIYNMRDERVRVNPDGESPGRVKGIIRPRTRSPTGAATPTHPLDSAIGSGQRESLTIETDA